MGRDTHLQPGLVLETAVLLEGVVEPAAVGPVCDLGRVEAVVRREGLPGL